MAGTAVPAATRYAAARRLTDPGRCLVEGRPV